MQLAAFSLNTLTRWTCNSDYITPGAHMQIPRLTPSQSLPCTISLGYIITDTEAPLCYNRGDTTRASSRNPHYYHYQSRRPLSSRPCPSLLRNGVAPPTKRCRRRLPARASTIPLGWAELFCELYLPEVDIAEASTAIVSRRRAAHKCSFGLVFPSTP